MKHLRLTAAVLFILAVNLSAQSGPSGKWRAVLVKDGNMVWNEIILVLSADGTKLTGTADVGHTALVRWPGLASIHNGKVDGNAFSFDWWGTASASFGAVTFTGTVDGDRMSLTMASPTSKYELRGERLPNP